ncbi:MAG TPA: histidine kinase [Gemmatimonadales bacterium]|nr:histidine kinase [Gemmatimonadales bacterium]
MPPHPGDRPAIPSSEPTPLRRAELIAILAFWTFLAVLTAANAMLDPRGRGPLKPVASSAPVALAFVEAYLWAALTPLIFRLAGRYTPERPRAVPRILLLLGVGVLTAVFVDLIVAWFRFNVFGVPRSRPGGGGPLANVLRLWWFDDFIVYLGVIAAGLAREYFHRYQARWRDTVRLQSQAAELHAQLAEARLSSLRTQLNPHFLFNTLNTVSALVERDPRGVRRMIARLSELLRATLEGGSEAEIPLQRELDLLQRYLEILQIRFQGRLETSVESEPGLAEAMVPNLILQPLVENAIKHGVGRAEGCGRIDVRVRREGGDLVMTVRDSGAGGNGAGLPPAERGTGVGLRNTRARLEQLYGHRQRLALDPVPGGGMIATIAVPLR